MTSFILSTAGVVSIFCGVLWYLWDKHSNKPAWLLIGGGAVFFAGAFLPEPPTQPVWHEENDPYECFGAGRYDAMRDGRACPSEEN